MNFLINPRFEMFIAVAFLQFGDWASTFLFSGCGGAEGNPLLRAANGGPDLARIAIIKLSLLVMFAALLVRKRKEVSRFLGCAVHGYCGFYSLVLIWNVSLTITRLW